MPVKNYYAGVNISFVSTDGRRYDALIHKIANDSIYLRYFTTAPYTNIFGTVSYDTVTTYILQLHYKGIKYINTPKSSYRNHYLGELGRYAAIGGLGYTVLNIVNGLIEKADPLLDNRNARNVAIATGVGGAGLFLNRKFKSARKGNRYKIVYVNMSVDKP
ncbi:hypothetical protein LWM68_04545 [Niabella sp. W65]|nr:hypothetical protein [Niabella sp. W65]MCH7362101.1 hypothetical protein [Niabella sp. W65]ULT45855.1 hypothetical protein KRR40_23140 [Niabella sp. I65]